MDAPEGNHPYLTYVNVGIALAFIFLDVGVSLSLNLGVGAPLLIAAIRCIIQLSVMGLVLDSVFKTNHPLAVAGIALLLITLGTFETVINKSKTRFSYMLPCVFMAFICSVVPVSVIGSQLAIKNRPFWTPSQYIPILGMLCGNTISALVVSVQATMKELHDNRDKTETMLAMGASRFEACLPVAKDALNLALTPVINQTSVLGIISIPGLMSGAILGGSSVDQAAKLQMIMMFLIASSTALATMVITIAALLIVVDSKHRLRQDRIDTRPPLVRRGLNIVGRFVSSQATHVKDSMVGSKDVGTPSERQSLLG